MAGGKFEQGNSGRPKGSKNKTTLLGRELLEQHFFEKGGLQKLLDRIEKMEYEKDKVNAEIKLLEYILPKQKEIDHKGTVNCTTSIEPIQWVDDTDK